jgi:hypothetical protein
MTIRFYDVEIEEMREATQEDWDERHRCLVRMHAEVVRLRSRIIQLQATSAVTMGTLEPPPEPEAPFAVTPAESNTPR